MSFINPRYSTAIYLILITVLLIIFFNITNMIEENKETIQKNNFKRFEKFVWENQPQNQKQNTKPEIKKTPKTSIITGFVTSSEQPSSNNKYPLLSYLRYYATILSLIAGITVITMTMISQRRKNK